MLDLTNQGIYVCKLFLGLDFVICMYLFLYTANYKVHSFMISSNYHIFKQCVLEFVLKYMHNLGAMYPVSYMII